MDKSEFLERYLGVQQSVYAYIRGAGFGVADADDLAQEVAVALWKSYDAYDPAKSFEGWAIGVARNVIRNKRRYDRVRGDTIVDTDICQQIGDLVAETVSKEKDVFDEEREKLEHCMKNLPDRSRELLRLRYYTGLDLGQIARSVRSTYGAVNITLSRARSMLIDCVKTSG
ncbi:MAG: hypothetical protein C0404_10040 [Verrucomicrobia bacterium]|nr:hypothetical protein [Verrucomicrobiota bacterium]